MNFITTMYSMVMSIIIITNIIIMMLYVGIITNDKIITVVNTIRELQTKRSLIMNAFEIANVLATNSLRTFKKDNVC